MSPLNLTLSTFLVPVAIGLVLVAMRLMLDASVLYPVEGRLRAAL